MILKKWDDIPEKLKNDKVKEYYDLLNKKKIQLILKRFFDIVVSGIMLIILSPVFLILAIAIKMDSKGPVFYRQKRITQYGRAFYIFKFRTMIYNADKVGTLVTIGKDPRITKVGNKIRKCRLDEIPQLINIFLGDMSFVGTRPEVEKYVEYYTDEMKATLLLKAGVTSTASIEYKDEDDIILKYLKKGEKIDNIYTKYVLPQKMLWNLKDIKEFSILKDLKIEFRTIVAVLK